VQSIAETEFLDASLGVHKPHRLFAQIITPGYVIKLAVEGRAYEYRASAERLVFVPQEGSAHRPRSSALPRGYAVSNASRATCRISSTSRGLSQQRWISRRAASVGTLWQP